MSRLTREAWLEAHPYLRPVAGLCARVESAAAGIEAARVDIPRWDDYLDDFLAGVPLLQSAEVPIDLERAGQAVASLVGRLASDPSAADAFGAEVRGLQAGLRADPSLSRRALAWLLGDDSFCPPFPGLLRYLGWSAMGRHLLPLVKAFDAWRDDERWLRRYCPTCGSAPAMAQLAATDSGRKRLLVCGCCGTRWQFRRTECPFCESDSSRASGLTIEGEGGLRIDSCEACRGYLKTYDGEGNEAVLLLDWTSLHLDLVAHDRGLKRSAASLFALRDFSPEPPAPVQIRADG